MKKLNFTLYTFILFFWGMNLHAQSPPATSATIPQGISMYSLYSSEGNDVSYTYTWNDGEAVTHTFNELSIGTTDDMCYKAEWNTSLAEWGGAFAFHFEQGIPADNFTTYNYLHIDLWSEKVTADRFVMIRFVENNEQENNNSQLVYFNSVNEAGSWKGYDFPLTDFGDVSSLNINRIEIIIGSGASSNGETFYVDNIYFYKEEPEPEPEPGPTTHLTPPDLTSGTYYSFYSDKLGDSGTWSYGYNSTCNDFQINNNSGQNTKEITLTPPSADGANVQIAATTGDAVKDISEYTHIHFDIWLMEELQDDKIRLNLYPPVGSNNNYQVLYKSIPSTGTTEEWLSYDWKISDFSENLYQGWTAEQLKQNFQYLAFSASENGAFTSKTFYIDNVYLYTKETDPTQPRYPAYLPPAFSTVWGAENVISLFSDSYTNEDTSLSFDPAKQDSKIDENAGENVWQFDNTTNVTITGNIDVLTMDKFHIDVWTEEAKTFQIKLNDDYTYPATGEYNTTGGSWSRIDIDLDNEMTSVTKIEVVGGDETTYFIDNVYFYKDLAQGSLSIDEVNTQLGRGINLGNFFDGNVLQWDPAYVDVVADMGFSHIRLPINLEINNRSMQEAPYIIQDTFIKEMQTIIDSTLAKDMKIIFDFHHHNELKAEPREQWNRFLAQWEQVANYFRYYPEDLLFELLNEPTDSITSDVWNELLVDGLNVVRATNPTRPVIIGTTEWGGTEGVKSIVLPEDDNRLILTVHYYNPFNFTHQGQEWLGEDMPPAGVEWFDTQEERDAMESDFTVVNEYIEDDARPIYYGEYGTFAPGDMDSRVRWITYLSRYYENKKWSYALWNFSDIYDIQKGEIVQPIYEALFNNPMPEKPYSLTTIATNTLYDSNTNGYPTGWASGEAVGTVTTSANQTTVKITNGGENAWDVQIVKSGLTFKKGSSYRISFLVSSDHSEYSYLFAASRDGDGNTGAGDGNYTAYGGSFSFTPEETEKKVSATFTMQDETSSIGRLAFDLGKVTGATQVSLYFKDFLIEEVDLKMDAASKDKTFTRTIYSSLSDVNPTISFSEQDSVSYITNNQNKEFIEFRGFSGQTIKPANGITTGKNSILYMKAFAGSPLKLTVNVSGREATFDLPSHEWYNIEMPLDDNTDVNTIELSGGTGLGRKLYLDHIGLYYTVVAVGIDENTAGSNTMVFADSKGDNLIVKSDKPVSSIDIYNVNGQLLKQENSNFTMVDISSLSQGVFIVSVKYPDNSTETFKISK